MIADVPFWDFVSSTSAIDYAKASSIPSAACLPMEGIKCDWQSRLMVMLT